MSIFRNFLKRICKLPILKPLFKIPPPCSIEHGTIKNEKSNSWFVHARKIFLKYELGDIHEHLVNPPEKNPWKATINKTVNKYWQNDIITSSAFYSILGRWVFALHLFSRQTVFCE